MASSGQVVAEISKAAGYLPNTVLRMVRVLQDARMAPLGTYGRGKHHGQFEREHLSNLLLAFAGHQPSHAAVTAAMLRQLPTYANDDFLNPIDTLGGAIGRLIDDAANGWVDPGLTVCLSVGLRSASISRLGRHDYYKLSPSEIFERRKSADEEEKSWDLVDPGFAVQSEVRLYPALFYTAGYLWADTIKNRPDLRR